VRRFLEITAGLGLAWIASHAGAKLLPAASSATPSASPSSLPPATPSTASSAAPPEPQRLLAPPVDRGIGPAFDSDASMARHADTVASYTLRASLDPAAHSVQGEGQIVWRNTSRLPQRELWIHLYPNAFKNERTLFNRLSLGHFRGAGTSEDWGHIAVERFAVREMDGVDLWPHADKTSPGDPEDETDIRVPLPREVAPGASLTIDLRWREHLPSLTFRSGHFGAFHMVGQWFPKLARLEPDGRWAHFAFHRLSEFYADFGTYDVTVDTPDNVVVGATGQLVEETKSGGRVARRFVQEDVHDFGFAAWDDFQETSMVSTGGVALRCLYPRGAERAAAVELEVARFGLEHMGKAYGAYPYKTLTLVHPPEGAEEAGGMEYPTLITTGGPWYLPWTGVRYLEIVTLHELGHQWFYGLVATDEHTWPFLDEGMNSFAEVEAMEALFPGASGYAGPGLGVSLHATNRFFAVERAGNAPVAQPAPAFQSGADYGSLVYQRAALIVSTFARVYGEERVLGIVGRYARRYRFEHPGPDELIGAFAEQLGDEAAANLRAALFDRASVDYAVSSFRAERERAPEGIFGDPEKPSAAPLPTEPDTYRGQIVLRRRGALRFPVDVELTREDGSVERLRWEAKEPIETLPYRGSAGLRAVVIDPEHRVLLDDNFANNAQRLDSPPAARVLERALFHAQAGLGAVLP
jgi:hypothetical protein